MSQSLAFDQAANGRCYGYRLCSFRGTCGAVPLQGCEADSTTLKEIFLASGTPKLCGPVDMLLPHYVI